MKSLSSGVKVQLSHTGERAPVSISSLAEICDNYDYFIIDQWGVLHNGRVPYPTVIPTLEQLSSKQKSMLILSNSSRRKVEAVHGMNKVGIACNKYFDDIVTSGEIAWNFLSNRQLPIINSFESQPKIPKVFVIGNGDDDEEYVTSAGLTVASPDEADFVLVRGTFSILTKSILSDSSFERIKFPSANALLDAVKVYLQACADRQLPMIVTNPDRLRPDVDLSPMPGQIGEWYKRCSALPLSIEYIGKPFPSCYDVCLQQFEKKAGRPIDPRRVLCIGDSVEHDVAGAQHYGLDSLWIVNGVHTTELNRLISSNPSASRIPPVTEGSGILPPLEAIERFLNAEQYRQYRSTYLIPAFM